MNYTEVISTLLMIIGGVTILTNLIVQVFKTVTWDKIPTNFLALIVAEVLTLPLAPLMRRFKGSRLLGIWCLQPLWSDFYPPTRPCWDMTSWSRRSRTGLRKLDDRRSRQ